MPRSARRRGCVKIWITICPLLLSDAGPFKGCSIKNGHAQGRNYVFPTEEPPESLYDDQNI